MSLDTLWYRPRTLKPAAASGQGGTTVNEIETERIHLRPFVSDDLDDFVLLGSDPDVMRFIGSGRPQSKELTAKRLKAIIESRNKHGFGLWAAINKNTREWMGFCGLQYLDNTSEIEVGYRLAKRFWGRGFATEAAAASLRYGFDQLCLERIVAVLQPANFASQRVLEKIGLRYISNARFYDSDVKYYSITRDEYERDEPENT